MIDQYPVACQRKDNMRDKLQKGEIILFQSNDRHTKIQVRFEEKSVWLSQKKIADLYQVSVPTVNEYLAHIIEEGELTSEATIRKFRIVQTEGKRDWAIHGQTAAEVIHSRADATKKNMELAELIEL